MASGHRFEIYDELHGEPISDHGSFEEALAELKRLASLPWNEEPNRAPCMSWETCGRSYELIEYDPTSDTVWPVRHIPALEVGAEGVVWDSKFPRP